MRTRERITTSTARRSGEAPEGGGLRISLGYLHALGRNMLGKWGRVLLIVLAVAAL